MEKIRYIFFIKPLGGATQGYFRQFFICKLRFTYSYIYMHKKIYSRGSYPATFGHSSFSEATSGGGVVVNKALRWIYKMFFNSQFPNITHSSFTSCCYTGPNLWEWQCVSDLLEFYFSFR